jgi:hypothetical protein
MTKVNKNTLILISGLIWSSIGILLIKIALKWFILLDKNEIILAIIGGIILGTVISYFGFSSIAKKNIERINMYIDKVCIFAFQKWQSYLLIIFMISLGLYMRKTSFIPKTILAPMYIGIGFALFTASFKYYIFLYDKNK